MTDAETASIQMPRYQCHKKVWALKIEEVRLHHDKSDPFVVHTVLVFWDAGYAPIAVSQEYAARNEPKAGGYYVVYDDGYASFSPADAFEAGYTRIALGD